jgi:Flp pilus assembly protein TadG
MGRFTPAPPTPAGRPAGGHPMDGHPVGGRRLPGSGGDDGSLTVLVVFFALIALVLASMLVDVGNALNARERAADVAEQAARAGADDVNVPLLRTGTLAIDTSSACGRAQSLVAAYGAQSGLTVTASCPTLTPQQIAVSVSVTTTPLIAASLGNFTVHATATAEPVCGITQGGQC